MEAGGKKAQDAFIIAPWLGVCKPATEVGLRSAAGGASIVREGF
jgi:hypothetical protein